MKTNVAIDRDLERRVLQLLVSQLSPAQVTGRTGLSLRAVEEIATTHGYPNRVDLEKALELMAAEDSFLEAVASGSALVSEPPPSAAGKQLRSVPVVDLHPDPDNPRDDLGDVEELADSIRSAGLLQPIVARQRAGALIVVAGHRRLAAVELLGWDVVDVVVTRDMRPDEVLAAMIIENGQRRDLDPIEEARAFARLKKLRGLTSVELSERIGRGQAFVDSRLRLLDLPASDQDKIRTGQMGVTHGALKARVLGGNVRSSGGRIPHLGADHSLAGKARARCLKLHQLKRTLVGKTACGDCWESVIRTDERHALTQAAIGDTCATCGHTEQMETTA